MDILHEGLLQLGFEDKELCRVEAMLNTYIDELLLFNKRRRMVNTDDRNEIVVRHVLDCMAALHFMKEHLSHASAVPVVADVGSGAGFPCIPLSCAMMDCRFTLIERMASRAAFLENVAAVLHLDNVEVWQCDAAKPPHLHFADIVTARAVAPLDNGSIKIYQGLAKIGGLVALYKTPKAAALSEPCGKDYCITPLFVPFMEDRERCIISWEV